VPELPADSPEFWAKTVLTTEKKEKAKIKIEIREKGLFIIPEYINS